MTMHKSFLLIAVAVLCMIVFSFVTGCDMFDGINIGGDNDGGDDGGGDGDVALGTARILQPGDIWTYRLTGTFQAAGGGTSQITPANVLLAYSPSTVTVGGADVHTWTFSIPISWPGGPDYHEVITLGVDQLADGTLHLHGISPAHRLDTGAVQGAPGYVAAPPGSDIGPLRGWNASATIDQYGAFNIDMDNDGPENVTVGGTTYACLKVTGTKDLGGFGSEFTAWLNPQTGSFVRMINAYTDVSGTTSMTYELQSTNFAT